LTSRIPLSQNSAAQSPAVRRRDLIASERRTTHTRWKKTAAAKSFAKIATASMAVALLFVGYILPAYAGQPTVPSAITGPEPRVQAVQIARTDIVTTLASARDAYSVTSKPRIVFNPYSRTSDDFANNPNNLLIQWPFSQGVPIASGFGPRKSPCGGCSSFHEGLDLTPGVGTPIQAIADGVVSEVGNPSGSFGVYAVVDHVIDGQKVSSLYGHMQRGSLNVSVGDTIKKGQIVGSVGSTGASSGPHLHISILLGGTVPIDPFAYLKLKVGS
jgi:murein DD-endopeptidase MepM/ murein hydrolase activator NlpD